LAAISGAVVVTGLLGMLTMLLAGLAERRREMALLRAVGAGPRHIFLLLVAEATALTVAGAALGVGLVYAGLLIARPIVDERYGLWLSIAPPTARDVLLLGIVVVAGLVAGAVPALRACRQSLADGMIARN
ncbi:MAG: FtsX-like permease family protein, partial [Alphaproteobacteria bacterium]